MVHKSKKEHVSLNTYTKAHKINILFTRKENKRQDNPSPSHSILILLLWAWGYVWHLHHLHILPNTLLLIVSHTLPLVIQAGHSIDGGLVPLIISPPRQRHRPGAEESVTIFDDDECYDHDKHGQTGEWWPGCVYGHGC